MFFMPPVSQHPGEAPPTAGLFYIFPKVCITFCSKFFLLDFGFKTFVPEHFKFLGQL
jgi:hypothetical protein